MKRNNGSFHQQICARNRYSNYKEGAHIVLPPAFLKQVGSNGNTTDFYSGGAPFESPSGVVRRD